MCAGPADLRDRVAILVCRTGQESTFIKPAHGRKGTGCEWLNVKRFPVGDPEISDIWHRVVQGTYLFQECITQHPEMDQIYPSSINTVRIDTYLPENKEPEVISARLRFGAGGAVVDNSSQGGGSVGIELETGRLRSVAFRGLEHGAATLTRHPDTGVLFGDFTMPHFEEVKQLARDCARAIPNTLVGWDIAVTPDGPTVIEGNWRYNIPRQQMACGGFRANPVFRKVLDRYGL